MPSTNPSRAITQAQLVAWLDHYLDHPSFTKLDKSLNGLQLDARPGQEAVVGRIAVAVDSTLATIEAATAAGADLLIVHHGWFWGRPLAITGMQARRVAACFAHGLSLYATHLPLDAHPVVGNNVQLARGLGLVDIAPWTEVGFRGRLPVPLNLSQLADQFQRVTGGDPCLVHGGGDDVVETVGIIAGGAASYVAEAAQAGLDVFITGEPSHIHFPDPFELGINVIYGGHYDTEMIGVRALAVQIEDEFGIPWQFLHLPTGL
jgi:dinuclear metal center YbgI/SA1388 family protein